jgi:hypothetical protein
MDSALLTAGADGADGAVEDLDWDDGCCECCGCEESDGEEGSENPCDEISAFPPLNLFSGTLNKGNISQTLISASKACIYFKVCLWS